MSEDSQDFGEVEGHDEERITRTTVPEMPSSLRYQFQLSLDPSSPRGGTVFVPERVKIIQPLLHLPAKGSWLSRQSVSIQMQCNSTPLYKVTNFFSLLVGRPNGMNKIYTYLDRTILGRHTKNMNFAIFLRFKQFKVLDRVRNETYPRRSVHLSCSFQFIWPRPL